MKLIEMKAMREEDVEVMEDGSQSGEVATKKGHGHNLHKHVEEEHLAYRTKTYGNSMRHVLLKMPIENAEFPQLFRLWKSSLRYTKLLVLFSPGLTLDTQNPRSMVIPFNFSFLVSSPVIFKYFKLHY